MEQLQIDFDRKLRCFDPPNSMTVAQAIFHAEALVGHALFMFRKLKEEDEATEAKLI